MATEFKFNNTKEEEKPVVDSTKSNKSSNAKPAFATPSMEELTGNTSEDKENASKIKEDTSKKKAIITYVGNGVWRDAKGVCWSRVEKVNVNILTTRSYDEAEYNEREDLKFMVKYGEMKLTLA